MSDGWVGYRRYYLVEWYDVMSYKRDLIPPPGLPRHIEVDPHVGKITIPGGSYDLSSFLDVANRIKEGLEEEAG